MAVAGEREKERKREREKERNRRKQVSELFFQSHQDSGVENPILLLQLDFYSN